MSSDLINWGATFTPAAVQSGEKYWKLIIAEGPMDLGGNHHLYVDVWGLDGIRQVGVPVEFWWGSKKEVHKTESKTGEPYSVNLPLYAGGNAYGVRVDDGLPSDELFGVGLGNKVPHHCFRAIFQLAIADEDTDVGEPPTVPQVDKIELRINGVWYDAIRRA